MMYFDDHAMGSANWFLWCLVLLLFWGAALAVLVAVLRGLWTEPRSGVRPDPLRLLDEKLARGELDEREYLRRRRLLLDRPGSVKAQHR